MNSRMSVLRTDMLTTSPPEHCFAEAERFELPSAVLETAMLPLHHTPVRTPYVLSYSHHVRGLVELNHVLWIFSPSHTPRLPKLHISHADWTRTRKSSP